MTRLLSNLIGNLAKLIKLNANIDMIIKKCEEQGIKYKDCGIYRGYENIRNNSY